MDVQQAATALAVGAPHDDGRNPTLRRGPEDVGTDLDAIPHGKNLVRLKDHGTVEGTAVISLLVPSRELGRLGRRRRTLHRGRVAHLDVDRPDLERRHDGGGDSDGEGG